MQIPYVCWLIHMKSSIQQDPQQYPREPNGMVALRIS